MPVFRRSAQFHDVLRDATSTDFYEVALDPLTGGQCVESTTLDSRMMNVTFTVGILGLDKSVTLGVVEPLDRSGCAHGSLPSKRWFRAGYWEGVAAATAG